MSSNKETTRGHRKKRAQDPDLSAQYREIGIKAVAAAAHDDAKGSGDASGDQEEEGEGYKKRARAKAHG